MKNLLKAMSLCLLISGMYLCSVGESHAQTTSNFTFGGFVDTYYAFDFNRPASRDRAYTTQPLRHTEFNIK